MGYVAFWVKKIFYINYLTFTPQSYPQGNLQTKESNVIDLLGTFFENDSIYVVYAL